MSDNEFLTDNDKIKFISYNRTFSFQRFCMKANTNKAKETPPLPLLQAHLSIAVKLTVSRGLQIKQRERIPNKWFAR